MAMVPWRVQVKAGRLAVLAVALATALVTSARLRPRRNGGAAPPAGPGGLRARIVPARPAPAQVTEHSVAVSDLCTCVSELASDLAKRYGGET
ncbi:MULTISPECIES: hypothetical protein [Streptomyces]|uniref:Uncharacterized protein n=1 Tax=Streptomyces xanthii TaxID=2768069 RepID=A0A7H1B321_9ACTN|nr:hypothetical protein [Streptomyces xanthii]QNS03126.1 hypothetical protein IAG42_05480 [Streptomyces xanthii]